MSETTTAPVPVPVEGAGKPAVDAIETSDLSVPNGNGHLNSSTTAPATSSSSGTSTPITSPDGLLASEWRPHEGVSFAARDSDGKYIPTRALETLPEVTPILHLFLSGKMKEAEDAVRSGDPANETLYYSLGMTLIQGFKAFMSFEDHDLTEAIALARHSASIANAHRKHSWRGYVSSSTSFIRSMTPVQRHAELCYQESTLIKAVLGIMHSGDWFAFVKEALNFRAANLAYRGMSEFIAMADKEAKAKGQEKDTDIDEHFRSGVLFGDGVNSLILSMLPSKVMTFVHLFGYTGDRTASLTTLHSIGGWTTTSPEPLVSAEAEGIRRPIADITLLIFHLLLANYTYRGIDTNMAARIVEWSFRRYPEGVFYLFAQGRINSCRSKPDLAVGYFTKMIENTQAEFKSLRNISLWELSICQFSLYDMPEATHRWRELLEHANWSKCVYTYALATCLYAQGGEKNMEEAKALFAQVPGLMQRIAGRSIPLEKYAARKATKFSKQNGRLLLPNLEMAYHFLCVTRAPRDVIVKKMLPETEAAVKKVDEYMSKPDQYEGGNAKGFWDEYCLAHFLHAVCLRYTKYPNPDAKIESEAHESDDVPEAEKRAFAGFQAVIDRASKIEVDHYIIYYTHYELGLLYACAGNAKASKEHLDLVLSGKQLIPKAEKGKWSMQSSLLMRTHAAMEHLGFEV
ncbi:hypothetical protein DL93DRAFT_2115004 [Clavulina sp. PMI_390]|nr:hypothetical protein DL93DRAFT_2115004 [Clavulina sp. PMI_390]